jgi:hypothetical protein
MGFPNWDISNHQALLGGLSSLDMVCTVTASWVGAELCHK